jgi:hypothetical protein
VFATSLACIIAAGRVDASLGGDVSSVETACPPGFRAELSELGARQPHSIAARTATTVILVIITAFAFLQSRRRNPFVNAVRDSFRPLRPVTAVQGRVVTD